ncbi:hypothetical protein Tco_0721241 [Tanacetum coccineum]
MRVLFLHLVFTLPCELRTSPRVLAYLDNWNATLLQTLDLTVHDLDRFFNEVEFVVDLNFIQRYSKRSNIMRVQLSPFAKAYHSLPRRYLQHDLISHLKLKGFLSYVGIALLMIMSDLDMALNLNNLLSCLVDDIWASELTISNFSPTDR